MLGETIVLRVTPTEIPEPASLGILAIGGLCALVRRRRRS
jgi:hypothetical protein